ncbi:26S proteasome regulatory subunit Rpn6 [Babesia duncani]|uniref:26S proteasome regulatory subunit Rpn6 n=1 Tax=Babesia duncani TaxID=323732 RepID=A0AAD9PK88_9APIC|nr:26S proteasome regulatory subunit Rpn6 [Babesia duncani]
MQSLENLLQTYEAIKAEKDAIDASRAHLICPGARIGCCIYPQELMLKFINLNESLFLIASDPKGINILSDESILLMTESVILTISYHLIETGQTDALLCFLFKNESHFALLPQAKTAKLLRNVLERLACVVLDLDTLHKIFTVYRDWCETKHRTFLKLRLELKLIVILILGRKFTAALEKCEALAIEIKAIDDKMLQLDLLLIEAKLFLLLRNMNRMKICISNAKNIATNITVPTFTTAEIDLLSGILYMCEKDYKTAYSFLYESFEGFYMSLSGPHSYLYPTRVSKSALSTSGEAKSCHPTVSDLSSVFLTLYNLYEYHGNFPKTEDQVGRFYMASASNYAQIAESSGMMMALDPDHELMPIVKVVPVESLARADERKLVQALKYLLLSMVLNGRAQEMHATLSQKSRLKFVNHLEIKLIQKIGACYTSSNLVAFEALLKENSGFVKLDPVLEAEPRVASRPTSAEFLSACNRDYRKHDHRH